MTQLRLEIHKVKGTDALQISIGSYDENGTGHGYRIAGPKFLNDSTVMKSVVLDAHDRKEIRRYLDAQDRYEQA